VCFPPADSPTPIPANTLRISDPAPVAPGHRADPLDPDLAALVAAWPTLPPAIKAAILAWPDLPDSTRIAMEALAEAAFETGRVGARGKGRRRGRSRSAPAS
jgi:hypothetical protein